MANILSLNLSDTTINRWNLYQNSNEIFPEEFTRRKTIFMDLNNEINNCHIRVETHKLDIRRQL